MLRVAVAVVCCLLALVGAASFVVSPDATAPEAADFDRTVSMGLTLEERRALDDDRIVPRAQVVYSQFPYVVGYRGMGLAAAAVDDPLVRQQFGYPRIVYVEVVPSDVAVDDSGFLVGQRTDEWLPASDAYFVIDSEAQIPSGPTAVAFETETEAETFATTYGGEVVRWSDRERFHVPRSDGSIVRDRIDGQHASADENVSQARALLDRPTGTTVGVDEPTLRAALANADANTTIHLPPGTYEGPIEIDEPVTIVGDDATIIGDGNGTVVTITADDVAIAGVSIAGIGDSLRGEPESVDDDRADWDRSTEEAYGYSDAAIATDSVDRVLVEDVDIETPASGVVLRDTTGAVVDGVRVEGAEQWEEGFMGVVAMRSPAVIQNSTFVDGRDGVYTHRASGITVRDSRFFGGRFGVHLMYTSDALVARSCTSGQALSGVVIMTSPSGTAIADNVITDTEQGISTSGSDAYIGGNTVVGTRQGIATSAQNSLYTDNAVVANEVGFRASDIFPTSVIVRNDIADNERHVRATSGPLRVWSHAGEGNYWSGAEGIDRQYSPTDPVDGRLHRTEAARTLAAAPTLHGLRALRGSVPGMRGESVVDAEPRAEPVNATRLEIARALADDSTSIEEVCAA